MTLSGKLILAFLRFGVISWPCLMLGRSGFAFAQVEQAAALQPPPAPEALIRACVLIALMFVAGGFAFGPLVLASRSVEPLRVASAPVRRRALWVGLVCAAGAFALALAWHVSRSDVAGVLAGRSGPMFVVRIALLIILAVFLQRRRHESPFVLLPCAALLFTQSLLSHSASEPEWVLPTLADWVHMLSAAVWLGGVAMLALITPRTLAERAYSALGGTIHRFSPLAMACVLVVALTGIMQSASFVGSFDALVNTAYGRALLVKLALFAVLVGFGAFHQHVISPRLNAWRARASDLSEAARRFRVSILAEVGASMLILLAAGVMTALPPARDFVAGDAPGQMTIQTQRTDRRSP